MTLTNVGMSSTFHANALVNTRSDDVQIAPTIVPRQKLFHSVRGRTLSGEESLRLQGVWLDVGTANQFDSHFLQDGAGNGFASTVFAAAFISMSLVLAEISAQTQAS